MHNLAERGRLGLAIGRSGPSARQPTPSWQGTSSNPIARGGFRGYGQQSRRTRFTGGQMRSSQDSACASECGPRRVRPSLVFYRRFRCMIEDRSQVSQ